MTKVHEVIRGRQMGLYFQQYRDLPNVKREPVKPEEIQYSFESFAGSLEDYKKLDNSPADYDPRPGHLLLAKDWNSDAPIFVSYQDGGAQASISTLLLDEPDGGFQERHEILAGASFHTLTVTPRKNLCFLEATHWNRLEPEIAERQLLKLGRGKLL